MTSCVNANIAHQMIELCGDVGQQLIILFKKFIYVYAVICPEIDCQ